MRTSTRENPNTQSVTQNVVQATTVPVAVPVETAAPATASATAPATAPEEELTLTARRKIANSVIRNAKELTTAGFRGQENRKLIALVPLNLIKVDQAAYQREEKRHVLKMIREWDDSQCTMLLVNYRSAEGYFYVIDGQHRAMAAERLGIEYLACEIFVDLSVQEEARRFLYYNTGTKSLNPFETFKANICWGEESDTAIKEVCDQYDIKVANRATGRCLKSVSAARKIYRQSGTIGLAWIFHLMLEAHWEDYKESYCASVMLGLNNVYVKYHEQLNVAKEKLLSWMLTHNPQQLYGMCNTEFPNVGSRDSRVRLTFEKIVGITEDTVENEGITEPGVDVRVLTAVA